MKMPEFMSSENGGLNHHIAMEEVQIDNHRQGVRYFEEKIAEIKSRPDADQKMIQDLEHIKSLAAKLITTEREMRKLLAYHEDIDRIKPPTIEGEEWKKVLGESDEKESIKKIVSIEPKGLVEAELYNRLIEEKNAIYKKLEQLEKQFEIDYPVENLLMELDYPKAGENRLN